ncbi:glycoside hydrolase family 3 C-terminal domain-containing protein [Demequina zhanjiangensis]|uniref:Glycoside hydrolase family 3 C-terminal domain-containing protein n=1 Tax=Demequina zhanjiangensis TaxID=3051659 RepID=A0ABT8G139_9MICO|nr:glycoside hydrolase family 3 C-terminal domain-containing protein [Demequina sp. SYSU T00b26]MDN4472855.1 glycoside hydrolase family 3 C-terminal domain-containing protein [Demequina sp. SYSU T00b26]
MISADKLTLREKAALLSGESVWDSRPLPRLGLRSLVLSDGPHGVRRQLGEGDHLGLNASAKATCFPTSATVANSWDPVLAERIGEALGAEAAALGVDVLLGPGLNIKRSPLGGRNFEYFSEDPLLAGRLAAAYVRGIQSQGTAASPKHFAVNSQETRRMSSDSIVDERTLREMYLAAFETVVREASPRTIMSSYNKVNGEYAHENRHLLVDILRDEWGFDGVVVSDWGGGNDAVAAVKGGGTLEMPSPGLGSALEILAAVEDGRLTEADLDVRVQEMLDLHDWIESREADAVDHDANHALARAAAEQSVVLLRNEGDLLPLAKGTRVAVIGDFADTPRYQGAGSSQVNPTQLTNALEAVPFSGLDMVTYAQGFRRDGVADPALASAAVDAAREADVVLLYLGLDETRESEGKDRDDMTLAANQVDVLTQIAAVNDRVVVVLSAGSAVEMPWLEKVPAVVHAYLGGQAGAGAVLSVITGEVNPSGRLAETYPVSLADTPTASAFPVEEEATVYREGPYVGYRYYTTAGVPVLFPFGYGLSYTTFEYSDLSVTAEGATFTLANTGDRDGAEVAQLYISRTSPGAYRPARELKGFRKIHLAAGESVRVTIPFDERTFRTFDVEADAWTVEAGEYRVLVGASVEDLWLDASHAVEGSAPSTTEVPEVYRTGKVTDATDADVEALIGRSLPTAPAAGARVALGANDPFRAMHHAKSPLGRLVARILRSLIARSEAKGKPDLNLYFLYNMPFRALAKMTNGAVSMGMVDSIVILANGHFFKGLGGVIAGFFRQAGASRRLKNELAAEATESVSI